MGYPYYEIHIIVTGQQGIIPLGDLCQRHGYWLSQLAREESGQEQPGDVILTTRLPRGDLANESIRDLVGDLQEAGYVVTRYKREYCDLDSRASDELELLT